MPTMEAILDPSGTVRFTTPFAVDTPKRVIVRVIPDGVDAETFQKTMWDPDSSELHEQHEDLSDSEPTLILGLVP
jgi:hypothetical protein